MLRTSILLNNDKINMMKIPGCIKMISIMEDKNGTMKWLKTPGIFCDCFKLCYFHQWLTQMLDTREIKIVKHSSKCNSFMDA